MSQSVPPSTKETAFSCPFCSALTSQHWFEVFADPVSNESRLPFIIRDKDKQKFLGDSQMPEAGRRKLLARVESFAAGFVVFDSDERRSGKRAFNLHLSKCYNCNGVAVWVHDRLLFPSYKAGVQPNPDLPAEIIRDFEEARQIVNPSPRGAAALLRLCIQKLCKHLGEKGKNIDDDIASLVKKGLNPLVQQSLDIVRVIGNEAVHPGALDLKDDQETALHLFNLVNAITDQMISHPKVVDGLYAKLPEAKRKAIEARDKK